MDLSSLRWERREQLLQAHSFDIDTAGTAAPIPITTSLSSTSTISTTTQDISTDGAYVLQHIHHLCSTPPWPHDPRDLNLSSVAVPCSTWEESNTCKQSQTVSARESQPEEGTIRATKGTTASHIIGAWGRIIENTENNRKNSSYDVDFLVENLEMLGTHRNELVGSIRSQQSESPRAPSAAASFEEMKENYDFRIEIHSWGLYPLTKSALEPFLIAYSEALLALRDAELGQYETYGEAVLRLKSIYRVLTSPKSTRMPQSEVLLGSGHILRLRLLAAMLRLLIENGNEWEEALHVAKELLPLYENVLSSGIWPPLALHMATLAKLEDLVGDPEMAAQQTQQALTMLAVCIGQNSRACTEMEGILKKAQFSNVDMYRR